MVCSCQFFFSRLTLWRFLFSGGWDAHRACTTSMRGEYVAMHDIDIDGAEENICRNFVDKLRMGGKPEKLKKVGHRTV